MSEIGFYHLTRTEAAAALPKLLDRTLAAGARAVVRLADAAALAALDASLWTDAEWLPHGTDHAALQPIWLTLADDAPNGATYLFLVGTDTADAGRYARVFDLFDGKDETAVAAARARWGARKDAGHALTYWRQTGDGWTKG